MKILILNISLKEMEMLHSSLPDLASIADSLKEIVKEERVRRILNEDKPGSNKPGSSAAKDP